jgi:hypothetical protein
VQDKNDPKSGERQHLLGDLESIKRLLREDAGEEPTAPEKIPILLDAVPAASVLKEALDTPVTHSTHAATSAPTPPPHHSEPAQPVTSAAETQLRLEGEQLLENLIDEYLPIIESRLREQLRMRLNFIIKEQMRKYR